MITDFYRSFVVVVKIYLYVLSGNTAEDSANGKSNVCQLGQLRAFLICKWSVDSCYKKTLGSEFIFQEHCKTLTINEQFII